ncbi:hypothetical protein BO71DRAFT_355842 [Aspergillus ellipticus CBS 707.79]|uniref:TM7S3/TM198-like domain-containing protein n=1 Tax=Aspergillus ellipticus CBS 707.79 TaxID=1448320 RepID=A0A319D6W2_9EURO|nr:hypothetical protein BO71DRAFT_355842 [Aspergillus ellipticus CBS 707.79]
MRLFSLFALAVCFAPALFVSSAGIPHAGLVVRETKSLPSTATETFSDTTGASVTSHATAKGNATTTSNTTAPALTTTSLSTSQPSQGKKDNKGPTHPDALPIQPTVTPALGIGGFILVVMGAVLALIGIRNLRVQVFLSTAFLTSLGVIVLIVYVMSPPVQVAVQGAYLVAVFFTGLTFGALALVFKELTEGLGCLLGGFCCSMWLLALKPGGLLTETDAKSGFIGAISLAFYALSFSHHTRPYGLMVSTGISGGTAVALGIDCFSRAGLKEFWLYIWALNGNIFPLGTKNYPITRNIRVELAATVIIAIMGVVSQLRLWKLVRERRRQEKEKRDEEQRKKEEAEAEVGRRLEEHNMQERKDWEAKYGVPGPDSSDSDLADEKQRPADELDTMEKGDIYEVKSIASSSEGSYRCSECREREANGDADSDVSGDAEGGEREQDGTANDAANKTPEECGSIPLKMFDGADAARIKDDAASDMTAVIGSETATIRSKRFSGAAFMKRMSQRNSDLPLSQSQEALVSVDDAASSVNGIMDEGDDLSSDCQLIQGDSHERTDGGSKEDGETQPTMIEKVSDDKQASAADELKEKTTQQSNEGQATAEDPEADEGTNSDAHDIPPEAAPSAEIPHGHGDTSKDSTPASEPQKNEETTALPQDTIPIEQEGQKIQSPEAKPEATDPNDNQVRSEKDTSNPHGQDPNPSDEASQPKAPSEDGKDKKQEASPDTSKPSEPQIKIEPKPPKEEPPKEPPKLDEETVKHLPLRTSKVVQSYRTNEWAKHLADAEAPQLEPIQPIQEEEPECLPEVEEAAVPVNVEELLQTPLNAQPPPAVEPREREPPSRVASHRISGSHTERPKKKSSSSNSPPPTAQPRLNTSPTGTEQLREDNSNNEPPKPQWRGPPPLIAVREDMVRNRLSSYSLATDPFSRTPRQSYHEGSRTPHHEEADDMPLSQRRAMLYQKQQQKVQPPPPAHLPQPPARRPQGPSPTNTPAAMAAWRESVHEDLRDKRSPLSKQNTTPAATRGSPPPYTPVQQRSTTPTGNPIAESMQRGNMSDLHREAMRRMQAQANKNVNGV